MPDFFGSFKQVVLKTEQEILALGQERAYSAVSAAPPPRRATPFQ
jgi:hypothetical protein